MSKSFNIFFQSVLTRSTFPKYINITTRLFIPTQLPLRHGSELSLSGLLSDINLPCFYDRVRGLLEKYPTFGRENETGLLRALDT